MRDQNLYLNKNTSIELPCELVPHDAYSRSGIGSFAADIVTSSVLVAARHLPGSWVAGGGSSWRR